MKNKYDVNSIFFYDSSKEKIKTESIFKMSFEGKKFRVKNNHINCLFSNLDFQEFDNIYNDFFKHLNLDFSPLEIENKKIQLSEKEQGYLIQKIITSWIYYYSINGLKIKVKKSDFEHPNMVDHVLSILDKKHKNSTSKSLKLGAKILRQKEEDYLSTVNGRRKYYER